MSPVPLKDLSESRRRILVVVKAKSSASISDIARELGVSHEAARKQVLELQRIGWLATTCAEEESDTPAAGRPPAQYCLTRPGENLFPKQYASLSVELLDRFGKDGLIAITDDRVQRLRARASGESPRERVTAALEIYADHDPYTSVEQRGDDLVLIERNCPFIDVAFERPVICSTTVSALRRATGHEVVRERRFQDGDGRCEFHVRTGRRGRKTRLEPEPPRT